jgi:hypothetical protein
LATTSTIFLDKSNKEITKDDYVVVMIKNYRIHLGSNVIKCIGYIHDIPTKEQIKKFYPE